jgi:ABC-type branched-subunit amino acid transport system substrate-binding protein
VRRLFEILSLIGINRVAVVYQDDGFGKDIVTGAERAAPATRVNLVVKAPYERNTTNVQPAVQAVLKSDPQVIYLGAVTSAAVEFIKHYRKAGGTAQIYGVSVIDINGMKKGLSPEELSGYGFGVLWPLTTSRTFQLVREYQQLAKEAKDPDLAERSMEGYIAAKVLVHGLRQARSSPAALSKAVGGMKSVGPRRLHGRFHAPQADRVAVRRLRDRQQGRLDPAVEGLRAAIIRPGPSRR